ncbi:MAG: RNA methyltransferase [Chloroflexi bacterium]|uniref:TrmH family RNA methyltransferase n=1 Tax=Candidatus Flexifilum breve TaxID=3140694 RepID=UPI003134D559|nr:RNA methyltransferase [Chloroflexota bacterium]
MSEQAVLEGIISIEAALRAHSRPIHRILIRRGEHDRDLGQLARLAEREQIPVERVSPDEIDAQAQGKTHGGVIALVGDRRFVPLDELIAGNAAPLIVMLDGVEDPFNFGQAVRAFYAAGADGLVVRPRNWMSAAGVVARSSAGASEWMPTAVAETTQSAADFLRGRGLKIAVADKERAVPLYKADLRGGLFVVIGGEKRGITRSFADAADIRLSIPYGRRFDQSLGTTAASAVIAFELMRQRLNTDK